ncbi:uncharacterized protein LOC111373296 [Olea europaea var. sylvestris]|nr:uncharacterized protein LOC111373296 [Olea europaea var. sylvestris]
MENESGDKVIYFDITKKGEEEVACQNPLMSSIVEIKYVFSCQSWLHDTKFEDGEQVVTEIPERKIWKYLYLEPQRSLSYRKMRKIINDAIRTWPIRSGTRKILIKDVFSRTKAM